MHLKRQVRTWLAAAATAAALFASPTPTASANANAQAPQAGRYLNLHQCVYMPASGIDYFTTVVPSRDGRFTTGTNTSDTANTSSSCGAGDGNFEPLQPWAGVQSLNLSAGRYLNLHQCVYYYGQSPFNDHFTTVVPTTSDGRFTTGTKVSNTADTTPTCGTGDGNFTLTPLLSGTKALSRT